MNNTYEVLPLLVPSLRALRDYMYAVCPEYRDVQLPLDFWSVEDDGIFLEILSYMPLHISDEALAHYADWPLALQYAYPIYRLEDDYEVNGWTALCNACDGLLDAAIAAYMAIGMESEARALTAAAAALQTDPDDEDAARQAYATVPNPYADTDHKNEALLNYFRKHPQLWHSYAKLK